MEKQVWRVRMGETYHNDKPGHVTIGEDEVCG